MNLAVTPKLRPVLDPEFLPAVLWNRAYRELVARDPGARPFALALIRADGKASSIATACLPPAIRPRRTRCATSSAC